MRSSWAMTRNVRSTSEAMEQLYLSRDVSGDITFIVQSERIHAHRSVLASASLKYKTQFYGLRPDDGEIHVPNVLATAFNEFLQLFYKDTIDLTLGNIETVLDLAKQSLVEEFVNTCIDFIKMKIIPHNVCEAYRLAILYDLQSLRIRCEEKITASTKIVFVSDGFLRCDHNMLLQILKLNTFNCTEFNVFNACVAWSREDCKRNQLDEKDTKNLRDVLGNVIHQIRFASMNIEQFVDLHKSLNGFFTNDEAFDIVYMIGRLKEFKSQWFNHALRLPYIQHQNIQPKPVHGSRRIHWKSGVNKQSRCIVIDSDEDDVW